MGKCESSSCIPLGPPGTGANITANDGLTKIGNNIILGGTTLLDKVIDMSVNNNTLWLKGKLTPGGADQRITLNVGSLNLDSGWNCTPSIRVSRDIADGGLGENCDLLLLTTGNTSMNGFFFLNFGAGPGAYLPNIRAASNAPAGGSAAFNLDLAGRDSTSEFSHFSVFFYDYDQYVLHGNQAPAMANSNLINFTNGTGGALKASTRHFLWVDKDYNFMIGSNSWTDRPLGAFQIGDNNATYGIYQKGANSTNWFAGNTRIGGGVAVATHQLEIVGKAGKTPASPYILFQDSTNTEVGRINFGGENTAIGLNALASLTTGVANVAIGSGALNAITTNRQNTAVGVSAGRGVTSRGNVLLGLGTGDLTGGDPGGGTLGDFNTILGAETVAFITGGSMGSGNIAIGAFGLNGTPTISDNNIFIGNSMNASGSITNSILIVTNPDGPMILSNVVVLGDQRHNILIGQNGASLANSGDRLQVTGSVFVSTLSGTGTRMVVANATGVLSTQAIPSTGVASFNTRTGAVTLTSTDVTTALGFTPVTNARTITTTSPLSIGGSTGGTSDFSANRTIAWDFSVSNTWTAKQSYVLSSNANNTLLDVTNLNNGASAQSRIDFHNDSSNTGNGAALFFCSSGFASGFANSFGVWNYQNGPIILATNGTEKARLLANGRFLLGTTADDGLSILNISTSAVFVSLTSTGAGQSIAFKLNTPAGANTFIDSPTTGAKVVFRTSKSSPDDTSSLSIGPSDVTVGLGIKIGITEGTAGRVGQAVLVAGTLAITITGLTTSSRAYPGLAVHGGTAGTRYLMVCTANTLTITAVDTSGATVTTDTSTINYFVVN